MDKEQNANQEKAIKKDSQGETKSLLQKRLIWQHLAQKKIKKVLRSRMRLNKVKD
jgi:hypothetical protein